MRSNINHVRNHFALTIVGVATCGLFAVAAHAQQGAAGRTTNATSFGILLAANPNGLYVAQVQGPWAQFGLQAGDQIVAVNGRRVATERALVGRLSASTATGGATIVVARGGNTHQITATAATGGTSGLAAQNSVQRGGGFLNPANMVITSDGRIMHKAVAARLGLESRPLSGGTIAVGPNEN